MRNDKEFCLWRGKRESPPSALPAYPQRARKGICRKLTQPKIWLFLLGTVLAFNSTSRAQAAAVTYTATNLSGTQWQYNYTLSGSYTAGEDLAIYFPYATSSTLTDLGTGGSSWTTFVLQPDTALSADGEFDIVANLNSPSLTPTFSVTFRYSGSGSPGAQSFTLYDASFTAVQTGTTSTAASTVPEPRSMALFGLGILLIWAIWRAGSLRAAQLLRVVFPVVLVLLLVGMQATVYAQGGPPGGGTPPGGGSPPGGGPPGGGTTTVLSGMTIGPYTLLSSYRTSTYQYYYTYTTSVTNTNSTPYTYVLGTLTSSNANTTVVSGSVEFGLVPAGGTASGLTAFTILQDRRYAFDPSSLSWSFTGSSSSSTVGTAPSAVTVSASSLLASYGTGVTLAAAVSPATSTGTITFYDGGVPLGTATLISGTASLTNFLLPTGSHSISALYSGDTTYASNSSSQESVMIAAGGAVTGCSGLQDTALVVCLANAFEATLTNSQIAALQLSYTLANAEVWTNLPGPTRNGLEFSSLTNTQLAAALQLAQAAMSSQGYGRFQNIRGADNVLGSYTNGYGAGNYYIALLGTPSTTSPWQLQIGGHHFAFNHTFNGQYASGTPYFIGNEPAIYSVAGTLYLPTQGPRDAAYALTRSVYGSSAALLSVTFDDVVMGSSGVDAYPHTYPTSGRGILYTSLSSAQQAQVKAMIEAWVNDMDSTTAGSLLSIYEDASALANTYVGYSGTGTLTQQGDYIRVDGPRVWIEFCVQSGIVFNQSYHFHTIWRDKTADYGGDFLGQ